jgi:hypothetical protein
MEIVMSDMRYLSGTCDHCGGRYAVILKYGFPTGRTNLHVDCPECRIVNIISIERSLQGTAIVARDSDRRGAA